MANTVTICKRFRFEAAHFLPGHPTCGEMHGHSYKVEIAISGMADPKTMMLMDFHQLGTRVQAVLRPLDHSVLNDLLESPTAEALAMYLYDQFQPWLFSDLSVVDGVPRSELCKLMFVRVWETEDCYAECPGWMG